jgi:hypothetical protein
MTNDEISPEPGRAEVAGLSFPPAIVRRQQRRMAVHQAAVQELCEHPESSLRVFEVLDRWKTLGALNPALLGQWRDILKQAAWDKLLEDSQEGETLRTGSPFAFALSESDRLAISSRYSSRA